MSVDVLFRLRSFWICSVFVLYSYVPSAFSLVIFRLRSVWLFFVYVLYDYVLSTFCGFVPSTFYLRKKVILMNLVQFSLVQYSVLSTVVRMASVSRRRRRN